jgi:hypothetical protein
MPMAPAASTLAALTANEHGAAVGPRCTKAKEFVSEFAGSALQA